MRQEVGAVLTRVQSYSVYDLSTLADRLQQLYDQVQSRATPFHERLRLVVVDSLGSLASAMLSNGSHARAFMVFVARLLKLLMLRDIAVVVCDMLHPVVYVYQVIYFNFHHT